MLYRSAVPTERDLTDASQGEHAMQQLVQEMVGALQWAWKIPKRWYPGPTVVSVTDNYDRLLYPDDGAARAARYSRYVDATHLLRTQMSAVVPGLLDSLTSPPLDMLVVCPGMVWRRDVVDRWHVGCPHQMDVWRLTATPMNETDLQEMIRLMLEAAVPGLPWRLRATDHPYTLHGQEIEVQAGQEWVEVGECGIAHPEVLHHNPALAETHGLAMGLGLDRLLMLRKGMTDIRLLRDTDRRVQQQMLDLSPYRDVSRQPAITRDMSLALSVGMDDEQIGDRARETLGETVDWVEELLVVDRTAAEDLPPVAQQRLGLLPGQENVLLRLVLRHPSQALSKQQANQIRNQVYAALHQGQVASMA